MDKYEHYESGQLRDSIREGRSVAALILILALVFIAYFAMRVASPEFPLHVYQALTSLPCLKSE